MSENSSYHYCEWNKRYDQKIRQQVDCFVIYLCASQHLSLKAYCSYFTCTSVTQKNFIKLHTFNMM